MRIPDFLRMNDWNIRRFSIVSLSILIAYDGIFLTNKFLFNIPILPQLLGFIVLTFIPGFIILRILKVHNIDRATNFLLAVGLSLSFIMIFGLIVNTFLPYLGIKKPITTFPLFCSFNFAIALMLIICYIRDRNFKELNGFLDVKVTPSLLFPSLLPIIGIFGAYFMTYYNINTINILLLFLVSIFPVLVAFNKISKNLYPFLIFAISLAILYHVNLISTYLWSFDIFFEAHGSFQVVEKGLWNPKHGIPLLLFAVLAPTYSFLCNLSLIWVFKIIFPFFFSLAPPTLYLVYSRAEFGDIKLDEKLALLSVFVFIFYYGFFKDMPDKQHIAELFLSLILMLMLTESPNRMAAVSLLLFSLITSHYGVSYVFMLSLIFALIMFYVLNKGEESSSLLTLNFVSLFSALAVGWYMFVASGEKFETIVGIGNHILNKITEILKPDYRSGISYLEYRTPSITWQIYKYLYVILQIFILIGILRLLILILKRKVKNPEIAYLSIAFYSLLAFQVFTTYGMGMDRVLQITLVLLSPFAVIGCITIVRAINSVIKGLSLKVTTPTSSFSAVKLFATFLMIFFLFNSGFIFAVVRDTLPPYCIALNKSAGWPVFNQGEVMGASWIKKYLKLENNTRIAARLGKGELLLSECIGKENVKGIRKTNIINAYLPSNVYVYFGSMLIRDEKFKESKLFHLIINERDKLYDNGKCMVFNLIIKSK